MKVLVLTFGFEPDLGAGAFRSSALVKALDANKFVTEVHVLTTLPGRYGKYQVHTLSEHNYGKVKVKRFSTYKHNSSLIGQSMAFLIYMVKVLWFQSGKEYDCVYASSSRLMNGFLGALIANKKKAFFFLDLRDLFIDSVTRTIKQNWFWGFLVLFFRLVENYTLSNADHVNIVSPGFEAYLREQQPTVSLSFYTNGIDDVFIRKACARDITFDQSRSIKRITYAGNIGHAQRLEKIVPNILTHFKDKIEFNIYGDGARSQTLEASVKKYANVALHGPVNRKSLVGAYENSDVLFLHLADEEVFKSVIPSKIFEYAATGKPIVAGLSGKAADFVRKIPGSYIFEPENMKEANYCLEKAIRSRGNIRRDKFIANYSRDTIMKNLVSTMVRAVSKKAMSKVV